MHTEAISDPLWEIVKSLDDIPEIASAYLGGGTGLALQLGHRISDDLDFFVSEVFDERAFLNGLQQRGLQALVMSQTPRHTTLTLRSFKIDLIKEQIPLKFPLRRIRPEFKHLTMADAIDIGRMKLLSIGSRGSKKDFIDLYCLTKEKVTLPSLIEMAMEENRGVRYSKLLFLKGLVDFEEAELEPDPSVWAKG